MVSTSVSSLDFCSGLVAFLEEDVAGGGWDWLKGLPQKFPTIFIANSTDSLERSLTTNRWNNFGKEFSYCSFLWISILNADSPEPSTLYRNAARTLPPPQHRFPCSIAPTFCQATSAKWLCSTAATTSP